MFLATVIVLISCVEITSSRSTVQICSVFSLIKHAHDAPLCEQPITNLFSFNSSSYMVKLYSFNPLWTMITTFQEKSNMYHISEPIIRSFFPKRVLLCSLSSSFHVIYQTRERVFHQDIQTPRGGLEKRGAAEFFWPTSRCLDTWWNTLSSFWYGFSNHS